MTSAQKKAAAKRKAAKPPKGAPGKVSMADRIRLGETASAVKASSKPADWKQIVNAAHAKGWTVPAALSDTPDALKARTKSSLKTETAGMVNEAYAPSIKSLDVAGQQAEGLRTKRLADEGSFNNWYAQQVSNINAQAQAQQAKYEAWATGKVAEQQQAAQANTAALGAAAQQGASGDVSGSIYLKGAAEREQASVERAKVREGAALSSGATVQANAGAATLGVVGSTMAQRAKIEQDTAKIRSDIAGKRLDLNAAKAKDIISEYSKALDTEMTKANAVQSYQGLLATTTQKANEAATKHQEFLIGTAAKTAAAKAQNTTTITVAGLNAQQRALDRQARAGQGALNRANALQIQAMRDAKAGKPVSDAKIKYSLQQVNIIHSVATMIQYAQSHNIKNMRKILIDRGYSTPQIDGGLSLVRYGRVKNPSIIKQLGILPQHRG